MVKAHELLARRGCRGPAADRCTVTPWRCWAWAGRLGAVTVRVADGEPGAELQVDFGKMGLIFDSVTGRRRVCWALIFTAVYSRHCFVWLSFTQTTETVIDGFEAAWAFFGGVFKVVIPDNMSTRGDQGGPDRAPAEPGVRRVRPVPGVRDRPGPGADPDRQGLCCTLHLLGCFRESFWVGFWFRVVVRRLCGGRRRGSGSSARPCR